MLNTSRKNPLKNPPDTGKGIGIQPKGGRDLTAELLFSGEKTRKPYHRQEQTSVPVEMRGTREGRGALGVDSLYRHAFFVPKIQPKEVVP